MLLLFFSFIYFLICLILALKIVKSNHSMVKSQLQITNEKIFLTVIIPFKNESNNLNKIVHQLSNQTLDLSCFEVIFVNDNSTDNSLQILSQSLEGIKFSYQIINNDYAGKKWAITTAVNHSKGNWLIFTDADTERGKEWLNSALDSISSNPTTKLFIGNVNMQYNNFFQYLQFIEFCGLQAWGNNFKIYCSAANMIISRNAFTFIGGYEDYYDIQGGDDVFLLHKVIKYYSENEVSIIYNANNIVNTSTVNSIKDYILQRLRWGKKMQFYSNLKASSISVFVLIYECLLLYTIISSFVHFNLYTIALISLSVKIVTDTFIINLHLRKLNINGIKIAGLGFQLFQAFIYPLLVLLSFFNKEVKWKA